MKIRTTKLHTMQRTMIHIKQTSKRNIFKRLINISLRSVIQKQYYEKVLKFSTPIIKLQVFHCSKINADIQLPGCFRIFFLIW